MYQAIVAKIRVQPHPNSKYERIQLGYIVGHTVIIGKDIQDGELITFFPTDGQIDTEFALKNDLLRKHPETGDKLNGYLEPNRHVKALKICEVKSEGIVIPVSAYSYIKGAQDLLVEGYQFTELNGVKICDKFISEQTRRHLKKRNSQNNNKKVRGETKYFKKHYDTPQFKYVAEQIPKGAVCYITLKVHGTSARSSKVLDEKEIYPWHNKIFKFFGLKTKPRIDWKYASMYASRNVILEKEWDENHADRYRLECHRLIEPYLMRDEIVYYEIVGYNSNCGGIMKTVLTEKFKDPELKKYGKSVNFSYGCHICTEPRRKIFIYRITMVNNEGIEIDLSWNQVKARAKQIGLPTVPELCEPFIYNGNEDELRELVNNLSDGDDPIGGTAHPREGIVLRAESENGILVAKNKGFAFKLLEGLAKEQDLVDTEEIS